MKYSFLLSFALGAGWLFSPESLVIAGNTAGKLGWLALPALAAAALLFALSGNLLRQSQLSGRQNSSFSLLRSTTGTIAATSLTIISCIPLVVLAATALLVTSGYTFNEVFLYWFPNFGFSFLLLSLLTLLQFFPEKIIFKAQFCFITLAAGGLLFLALSGIAATGKPVADVLQQPEGLFSASSAILFFLFTGSSLNGNRNHPYLIPIAGFIIFSLWLVVSLSYVNPERLASSTIPYMTTARKVMGDPGRQIMGVVVISGTCAAITALLLMCRNMLGDILHSKKSPPLLTAKKQRFLLPPLVALAAAILMARGLAGDELLEILLRSSLVLWMLYHCLLCLSAILVQYREKQSIPVAGSFSTTIILAALLTILLSSPHRSEMILFILSMSGIGTLFAIIWFFINKKINTNLTTQQTEKSL